MDKYAVPLVPPVIPEGADPQLFGSPSSESIIRDPIKGLTLRQAIRRFEKSGFSGKQEAVSLGRGKGGIAYRGIDPSSSDYFEFRLYKFEEDAKYELWGFDPRSGRQKKNHYKNAEWRLRLIEPSSGKRMQDIIHIFEMLHY